MTIGNLSSKIGQMPSTHRVVMVTLLPIPIKNHNIPQQQLDEQLQTNREVLNEVLRRLLQPLTYRQNPSPGSGYYKVLCADGNIRRCKPVLAAWLVDCPEYSDLHHLKRHVCFRCECPKNEPRDYVHRDKQHHRPDHNLYTTFSDADTKATDAKLSSRHVQRGLNIFRHIPCIVSDLPTHERLDKYNAIWLSVPAYHHLTPKNQSYEELSHWNWKKMKEMSWYLLGVVTQSPQGGNPAQRPIFNRAIECTRALLEFYMYARYQFHDDATLSYMEDALRRVHTFKDVFLVGRAHKGAKAKANALRTELVKKRTVDEETNAETWTPSKKRCEMNAWQDYISHEIDISKELDADFNFPKIHLMSHWAEQIC